MFLTSILSVGLRKNNLFYLERENHKTSFKVFNWMSVATLLKYLLKILTISCVSVILQTFSEIVDGATLGDYFKEIKIF